MVEFDGTEVSFVDAANPCVFVRAKDLGTSAARLPAEIAAEADVMARLEELRSAAGKMAGMPAAAGAPKVALVSEPEDFALLTGDTLRADDCDVLVRMISMGAPHLAIPLTGAMAVAVAAKVEGSVVNQLARRTEDGAPLRIGTASGIVPAMANVQDGHAVNASIYRTARTLMEGTVYAEV